MDEYSLAAARLRLLKLRLTGDIQYSAYNRFAITQADKKILYDLYYNKQYPCEIIKIVNSNFGLYLVQEVPDGKTYNHLETMCFVCKGAPLDPDGILSLGTEFDSVSEPTILDGAYDIYKSTMHDMDSHIAILQDNKYLRNKFAFINLLTGRLIGTIEVGSIKNIKYYRGNKDVLVLDCAYTYCDGSGFDRAIIVNLNDIIYVN